MTKPITPDEIVDAKAKSLPPEVFEAFNEMIVKNWNGSSSNFTVKEAAANIAKRIKRPIQEIYNEKFLDVEDVYRAAGWGVDFDRPGYNESYEANFTFKKGRAK